MARLLSFDLSLSNSGWAVLDVSEGAVTLVDYGSIGTKRYAQRSTGFRLSYIYDELEKLYKKYQVDQVVKERSFSNARITATQQIMKVNGVWEMANHLAEHNGFEELPPSTVKKWVTGNGRADKKEIISAVNERFDLNLKNADNDIADAIAVGVAYCMKEGLINGKVNL